MATATVTKKKTPETLAEALHLLGDIPPERILWRPHPGTATVKDVERLLEAADKRLCELVDGVLVEKPMGTKESNLAVVLSYFLFKYLEEHDLGTLLGADGALRLMPKLVRIPDISFISWDQLPNRKLPNKKIGDLAPDLAIEILSESNTRKEMERKLKDYFQAGVKLVWLIQPKTRTAEVYHSSTEMIRVKKTESLDGQDVLPGFSLKLADLFAKSAV